MAPVRPQPITFIVPGEELQAVAAATRGAGQAPLPIELPQGQVKQSVRVGAQRGGGGEVRMAAVPGMDMVVLEIANGPVLTLHPENARDLMLAQSATRKRGGANGKTGLPPGHTTIPIELRWDDLEEGVAARGATRGFLGRVLLKMVHVVTGDDVADLAASQVVERVDAQVAAGVYQLKPDVLPKLKGSGALVRSIQATKNDSPSLVLIHGTFSNTQGTFGKLWTQHPERVKTLFKYYNQQVYALDHPTLGESPISNALTLARALPKGARLHLVTHSRGGLVAEVLARVCAKPDLTQADLDHFKGDKYKTERDALQALAQSVKGKGIRIDRVVRVACPARGTLLASKRLDAYISVFKWTLELAAVPVAPELVDFLGQVARERTDPEVIPGLAAQMPDSPLVQWLHAVDEAIPGELRVVAGDMQGDSVVSWLKTLLSDAFYWTDNDLVVQTRSMYGGAPRAAGAAFVLDQGGAVSHFNYFSNERTAGAIVEALTLTVPPAFRTIGPLSWAGQSATGTRAARRAAANDKAPSDKPAVLLLPGILGSNLKVDGKRIWLGWRLINGLRRLAYDPRRPDGVEPDGPIDMVYDDLGDFLARTHEVIEFGFDWRRPIEDEARRLAEAVTRALDARATSGKPVRLLAHSMGGVLARTMQLEQPAVWQRMMSQPDARLLLLGTPNGGSWAPMQVLSGDDTFGNALVAFGTPFQDQAARKLMASFPGFLQLQAGLLNEPLKLDRNETWSGLAKEDLKRLEERSWWHRLELQLGAYAWGVPPQSVLDRAVALRRRLDAQSDKDLGPIKDAVVLVVGKSRFTPDGYEVGEDGLVYLDAQDHGDGRVTLSSAQLPGIRTWQLDCAHGDLPGKKEAFEAYHELLETGTTDRLSVVPAATRGGAVPTLGHVRSRPSRTRSPSRPPENEGDVLRVVEGVAGEISPAPEMALDITVHNGDLSFVRQPLMIGHYRAIRLTGTEKVMNALVGRALEHSLKAGLYPDLPGTNQTFVNTLIPPDDPQHLPRPEAVIVVGLGSEGKLRPSDLAQTVRQGVIAWAQRVAERPGPTAPLFDLVATLIGSGGSSMSAGQSARLIAQGVREANRLLGPADWPRVGHLHLIELYLDRASEAWRALQIQVAAARSYYNLTPEVRGGSGALVRPIDSGYRGADYDFFSAVSEGNADGRIEYVLDTRRARNEVRDHSTQAPLIRGLVNKASNDTNTDRQLGRTLCQLLIPLSMDAFLGGATELLIELDGSTAGIPWELLDTDPPDGSDRRPWAIRAKLLRRLRTAEFREQVTDADPDASVLVIGEPQCDPLIYPPLPGAREEAIAVAARLTAADGIPADRVTRLVSSDPDGGNRPDAHAVINALFQRKNAQGGPQSWRIVHIAGHGEPPEKPAPPPLKPGDPPQSKGDPRGVVLSDGFLGPREVHSLRVVPELVFVNCCYLGATDPALLLRARELGRGGPYDRVTFASGLAEELIKIGVRCVVAAGWAVDDGPAKTFATTFYDCLLKGQRFMNAVAQAREEAYALGGNTWAAYQCYGDPDWTLRRAGSDAQRPGRPPMEEFSAVASPIGLTLALRTLAVESEFQKAPPEGQRAKINYLEARFERQWGGIGHIAEAFGKGWAAVPDETKAIEWYRRAVAANDGTASLKATEQLGNLMARAAWEKVAKARDRRDALESRRRERPRRPSFAKTKARRQAAREIAAAERELQAAGRKAGAPMRDALDLLQRLVALQPTMERESLVGSAYKRQAMIAAAAGQRQQEQSALRGMQEHYRLAVERGTEDQQADVFHPGLNRMAADLVVGGGRGRFKGFDSDLLTVVKQSLGAKVKGDHDFWSAAGVPELMLYQALAKRKLAAALGRILEAYDDLHRRVDAPWMWASVYDQARFVLPKYTAKAPERERRAVETLLKRLETFTASRTPEEEVAATEGGPSRRAGRKRAKGAQRGRKQRRQ
jgi:hypothetical protein